MTIEKLKDDVAAIAAGHPLDVCRCGDFRHQHQGGTGRCELGEDCFPAQCQRFRLQDTAAEYAAEHPAHAAKMEALLRKHLEQRP